MKKTFITVTLLSGIVAFGQEKKSDTTKTEEIKEVVLQGRKPTIESKADRTVFNVANSSILSGNNTWDVLRMTPLVNIDNNDNLSAEGGKVTVYINDRKSVFTGKELKEYLKTIPADNMMKIEVITTPSAKYETSGAVINIVLKKNENEGMKGSLTMNNTQSFKNSQDAGININYHKKKFTQALSANYSNRNSVFTSYNENLLFANNALTKVSVESNSIYRSPSGSSSTEYEIDDKNNIGLVMEYYGGKNTSDSEAFGENYLNNVFQNQYTKTVTTSGRNNFIGSNLFYRYYDKEKNKILDINLGLNYDGNKGENLHFYERTDAFTENINIRNNDQNREYYLKIDYSQPIGKTGDQLEFGGKIDFNRNTMPYGYYNLLNNGWVNDATRSNTFKYQDNINSVYANFSKTFFKKLETRIGLRYEYIKYTIRQDVGNIEKTNSYGTLLPDLLVKYSFNSNYNLTATYKHNLWRPWYPQFNPFLMPSDNGTYSRGNIDLLPNTSDTFALKLGLYKKYFLSANYNTSNQDYYDSYYVEDGKTISMPTVFKGRVNSYSLYANTNQNFLKNKLNVNLNAGVSYMDNSDFNRRNNLGIKDYITNFSGSANISYNNLFNKNININGWFGLYSQNWGNTMSDKMNFFHNFGITKLFPSQEMEASVRFNNIFKKPGNDYITYSPIGTFRNVSTWDWYGVTLGFVKRFGNQKVKDNSKTNVERNSSGKSSPNQ